MSEHPGPADIVQPNLRILFVGYNPSVASLETGHHFAGRGNLFWALLADAGLTPRVLAPADDRSLLNYGLGIVNLVDRATPSSQDLAPDELSAGAERLHRTIESLKPALAAFLGKDIFRYYRGWSVRTPVAWGIGSDWRHPPTKEVVIPNPSRRSTLSYAVRLHYFALAACQSRQNGAGDLLE